MKYPRQKNHFNRDITDKILADYNLRQNKVGRYSVSRLWAILNGYCSKEDYLNGETRTLEDILRMTDGTMKHKFLEKYAIGETEVKKDYDCGAFVIVGIADELTDEAVIEYKTSQKLYDKPKSWHIHQTRMYLTIFERPIGIIYQPKIIKGRFILDTLGTTRRNDDWFNKEINKLTLFHQELQNYGK